MTHGILGDKTSRPNPAEGTLDRLRLTETAEVVRVDGDPVLTQRLLSMGFLPGQTLRVIQVAPFGDPMIVELDGWRISLRIRDARSVCVRSLNGIPDQGRTSA